MRKLLRIDWSSKKLWAGLVISPLVLVLGACSPGGASGIASRANATVGTPSGTLVTTGANGVNDSISVGFSCVNLGGLCNGYVSGMLGGKHFISYNFGNGGFQNANGSQCLAPTPGGATNPATFVCPDGGQGTWLGRGTYGGMPVAFTWNGTDTDSGMSTGQSDFMSLSVCPATFGNGICSGGGTYRNSFTCNGCVEINVRPGNSTTFPLASRNKAVTVSGKVG